MNDVLWWSLFIHFLQRDLPFFYCPLCKLMQGWNMEYYSLIKGLNKAVIYNCYLKYDSVALAECLKPCCQFFIGIEAQKGGGFGMIGGNRIDIEKTCCRFSFWESDTRHCRRP